VRGVALLAAATQGLPVAEYAPLTIKSSVVGYGLAKKEQVQFMVARLLELAEVPEPADAADALAIAICHIHTAQTLALQGQDDEERAAGVAFCCMCGYCSVGFGRGVVAGAGRGWERRSAATRSGLLESGAFAVALDADAAPGWERAFPF